MVRMRINRSATRKRRSHHGLTEPRLSTCKDCGVKYLRHRACLECGKYRGRIVIDVESKKAKKATKKIAQLEAIHQEKANELEAKEEDKKSVNNKSKVSSNKIKAEKKTKTTTKKTGKDAKKDK